MVAKKYITICFFMCALPIGAYCSEFPDGLMESARKSGKLNYISEETKEYLKVLMDEDEEIFNSGGETGIGNLLGVKVVDADDIAQDYENNEVDGDLKYKGKKLLVNGIVAQVDSDFRDRPAIIFALKNRRFNNPIASMDVMDIERIAKIRKGKSIVLICNGSGEVLGSALLSECQFPDGEAKKQKEIVLNTMEDLSKEISRNENGDKYQKFTSSMVIYSNLMIKVINTKLIKCDDRKKIYCYYQAIELLSKAKSGKLENIKVLNKLFESIGVDFKFKQKNSIG